jgi:hypothetical protein
MFSLDLDLKNDFESKEIMRELQRNAFRFCAGFVMIATELRWRRVHNLHGN